MFTNSMKSGSVSVMGAGRSVARRQLEASIGAVVVIAALATAIAFGSRTTSANGEQIARAYTHPVVVRSAVRVVPSEQMQASARSDPRS